MNILVDLVKLLQLLMIKAVRLVFNGSSVVPQMEPKPKPKPRPKPPKFRLVPDHKGTYNLEKWNEVVEGYLIENSGLKGKAEALIYIENLDRPIVPIDDQV